MSRFHSSTSRFQPSAASYGDSTWRDNYSAQTMMDVYPEGSYYGGSEGGGADAAGAIAGGVASIFSAVFTGVSQAKQQESAQAHEKSMSKAAVRQTEAATKLAEAQAAAAAAQTGLTLGSSSKFLYIGGALVLVTAIFATTIMVLKKGKK